MRYGVYYNYKTIGDVLIIVFDPTKIPDRTYNNDNVVALYNKDELVGINIFNISDIIKIKVDGFVPVLNIKMLDVINNILVTHGLEKLDYIEDSGFKVAQIVECKEHPHSNHLHILKVDIAEEKPLQIVSGSYNCKVGLKCVCATVGTFMPDGTQIVENDFLGVSSKGMLCSAKELNIENYEEYKGLLELDDSYVVGSDFFRII